MAFNFEPHAVDIEWLNLFEFQRQYRRQTALTTRELLELLKVPIYCRHYLYATDRVPALDPTSEGGLLRSALKKLQAETPPSSECQRGAAGPYGDMDEFLTTRTKELKAMGIISLFTLPEHVLLLVDDDTKVPKDVMHVLSRMDPVLFHKDQPFKTVVSVPF